MTPIVTVAADVARDWGLVIARPFALALHSFVAPAGDDVVLKITSPDDDESDEEAEALALWNGEGAVRAVRQDRDPRALLLERACPGDDASTIAEDEATQVAISIGSKLWRPASSPPFRSVHDQIPRWLEASAGRPLCEIAVALYAAMERRDDILVHGDLHHHNLLRHGDRWVAIDPKPMLGEPAYDVPSFLWNPIGSQMTRERTERRIAAFVRAGLDDGRIRAWAAIRGAMLDVGAENAEVIRAVLAAGERSG